MGAIPERVGKFHEFSYLMWPIMNKCLQEGEEDRPAHIDEIRRVVHLNLLYAVNNDRNAKTAIECVARNDDFDANAIHTEHVNNYSHLHLAVMCKSPELTYAVLSKGPTQATLDHKDRYGSTAVWDACRNGLLDIAKALQAAGANLLIPDNNGVSCLTMASYSGRFAIVEWLLSFEEVRKSIITKDKK